MTKRERIALRNSFAVAIAPSVVAMLNQTFEKSAHSVLHKEFARKRAAYVVWELADSFMAARTDD